jgi:hypothetical protein
MTPGPMPLEMSQQSRKEVLEKMKQRYARRTGRAARGRLLDEVCELCGYERKHALKVLSGRLPIAGGKAKRGGPRRRYTDSEKAVIKVVWLAAEQPCGKRLKAAIPLWLPHYEQEHGKLAEAVSQKLLGMSAATMDRMLKSVKIEIGKRGRCGTRPGTLLRTQIPVRTEHWDVKEPGYIEADTVAHCGESMSGDFVWSLTMTDVHSQWTETRASWNKGKHNVQERIAEVEKALPFAILGFDSDNGSEFMNWHLHDYFAKRKSPVGFTRSRPYRKNDNARVEQKNWTHVRQLVGYGRLETPEQAKALNELYAKEWSWFRNYFCPAMKHLRTEVEGSRKKRVYDKPQTPYERLKASGKLAPEKLAELEAFKERLNPFELKRSIERQLRKILRMSPQNIPTSAE